MKQVRIPTRQNQPVEILFFTSETLSPCFLILVIGNAMDSPNYAVLACLLWLKFASKFTSKGRGYLRHLLWSKGWLPKVATRGIPNPNIREYKR